MKAAVSEIILAIVYVVQVVPVGTNVGLVRLVWALVNGSFLVSRGAIHSGLAASEFREEEIRRSWSALHSGSWQIEELLECWQEYVRQRGQWRARRFGGYRVKSVDITGFWRPRIARKVGQHFHQLAEKALPAVVFGVVIGSGEIQGKRVPLLQSLIRCPVEQSSSQFRQGLLQKTVKQTMYDEITVVDAEFELNELHAAQVRRYVVRLANNCTARRNHLPTCTGERRRGRPPEFGELVRPLPRKGRNGQLQATPPDTQGEFVIDKRIIHYQTWHGLVSTQTKVNPTKPTFSISVFQDPLYKTALALATDMNLTPELLFYIYRDRWPVEHPPLATKQMLGLHRQFVSAPTSCFRLPELALLAGNLLTHAAAILPPVPSGFWDRSPKPTPGRLRRSLAHAIFPTLSDFDPNLRKKNSVFVHLPKGVDAHRRQNANSSSIFTGN